MSPISATPTNRPSSTADSMGSAAIPRGYLTLPLHMANGRVIFGTLADRKEG
jgi:hypothetical protein